MSLTQRGAAVLQIAAGNGEQVVSRDVPRLARRMNMPRLLSWYFTGGVCCNVPLSHLQGLPCCMLTTSPTLLLAH
jgi:hypothetical protein